jgi:hypothetical protein
VLESTGESEFDATLHYGSLAPLLDVEEAPLVEKGINDIL